MGTMAAKIRKRLDFTEYAGILSEERAAELKRSVRATGTRIAAGMARRADGNRKRALEEASPETSGRQNRDA